MASSIPEILRDIVSTDGPDKDVAVEEFRIRFGRRVRQLRMKRGMSQALLAQHLEVRLSHLSNIECGRYSIGFCRLEKLARVLDVELHELFRFNSRQRS